MTCPRTEQIIMYLDGELSVNEHARQGEHLESCAACRAQLAEVERLTRRLEPAPGEFENPALIQEVMQRVQQLPAEVDTRRWTGQWKVIVPALAAAAAAMILVLAPLGDAPPESNQYQARGGATQITDRWVALYIFQKRQGQTRYQPVDDRVPPDTRLVFGYRNARGNYGHLMIFAHDPAGEVYWFYPEYTTEGSDPISIAIKPGKQELPEEIQHTFKSAQIRVVGLFSSKPLRVSQVEALVKRSAQQGRPFSELGRLPLANTGQTHRILQVMPGAE